MRGRCDIAFGSVRMGNGLRIHAGAIAKLYPITALRQFEASVFLPVRLFPLSNWYPVEMAETILVVDDETSILSSLKGSLQDEGFGVTTAESGERAMRIMRSAGGAAVQAALVDIWMPDMDGIQLLDWLQHNFPKLPVIIMSGHGTIETAVRATKKGAYDFIEKPLSLEKILIVIRNALKEAALEKENEELRCQFPQYHAEIIGESREIAAVLDQVKRAAPTDGWVLIKGENGTGKELVAREIHRKSLRKDAPFIELNCAAIPEELIESELFGHEKGAFRDASSRKIGKFDQANGGTLFLDEIGDMSLKTQAKILRVLQEQRFEPVGGTQIFEVDMRIITASNKNLEEEIAKGNFREDLYYRLNVIPINVPPLRERKEDIPLLVDHFLSIFNKRGHGPVKKLSKEAQECMNAYHWPGNIRELKNIVERIVIMIDKSVIELRHIPPVVRMGSANSSQEQSYPKIFKEATEQFERQFIQNMLRRYHWNISKTAEAIQVERSNLYRKIKSLGIVVQRGQCRVIP